MRNYPVDSQNSMARVVVMVLMAEGAIDPSELRLLERPEIIARMGFDHACLSKVTQEFCQDLEIFGVNSRSGELGLDPATIDLLLAEIRSPELQANLLRAMLDIVYADGHLTGSEAAVIAQAMKQWGLDLCEDRKEPQDRRWKFTTRHGDADALSK
jgi:tellurite resistance protein